MRRPQFRLKTLLWLMVCVACFFAGSQWMKRRLDVEMMVLKEEVSFFQQHFGEEIHWESEDGQRIMAMAAAAARG